MEECGLFVRGHIGASPDGLFTDRTDHLLEIKTRACSQTAPLTAISKTHIMQVQVQMYAAGRAFAIVSSFHPETSTSSNFLVKFQPDFPVVLLRVLDAIKTGNALCDDQRWEPTNPQFEQIWALNRGKVPDFDSLAPLRRWCALQAKCATKIESLSEYFASLPQ